MTIAAANSARNVRCILLTPSRLGYPERQEVLRTFEGYRLRIGRYMITEASFMVKYRCCPTDAYAGVDERSHPEILCNLLKR
ncbi:hypothetical protein GCM10025859_12820 [Alicyclobacillus fastidiosus]|nr:hypothetical protein GCM10025859_12820 [Alicyclobacillus fastidiosus]